MRDAQVDRLMRALLAQHELREIQAAAHRIIWLVKAVVG